MNSLQSLLAARQGRIWSGNPLKKRTVCHSLERYEQLFIPSVFELSKLNAGMQSSKCVQEDGRYRLYSSHAGHALGLTPAAVMEFGLVLQGVWHLG